MNIRHFTTFPFVIVAAAAAGCAGPDLTMANPIVAGHVPQNVVVKEHGFAESHNGLPVGSMADQAVIEAADKQQVCVTVSLHELAAIDLTTAEIKLTSNTGTLLQPQLNADPPSQQTYQGLVAHTEQTGTRQVCRYDNGQTVCETQPIMSTTMVPGPVDVFNTKGRVCAQNQNLVTPTTTELALKISTPTAAAGGFMGMGRGSKNVTFRWAFQ
jgi:hypothetical protein